MNELLSFELPFLPQSVNKLYLRSRTGIYINPKAIDFKDKVHQLLNTLIFNKSSNKIKLIITFQVKKKNIDIDNMVKLLQDSMNKIVFDDDSQVYEIHARKIISKEIKTIVNVFEILNEQMFQITFD